MDHRFALFSINSLSLLREPFSLGTMVSCTLFSWFVTKIFIGSLLTIFFKSIRACPRFRGTSVNMFMFTVGHCSTCLCRFGLFANPYILGLVHGQHANHHVVSSFGLFGSQALLCFRVVPESGVPYMSACWRTPAPTSYFSQTVWQVCGDLAWFA